MIKPLIQKVIVAVNGSEQSLHAAMYGIMLAKQYKIELKVVYVVDTATLKQLELSKFFVTEESSNYESHLKADGEKYLKYIEELAQKKDVKIHTELRNGAVWAEIIKSAEEYKAQLILLGGKEHGSASMKTVLHHDKISAINGEIIGSASCNVLVVREPEIEKLFKLA